MPKHRMQTRSKGAMGEEMLLDVRHSRRIEVEEADADDQPASSEVKRSEERADHPTHPATPQATPQPGHTMPHRRRGKAAEMQPVTRQQAEEEAEGLLSVLYPNHIAGTAYAALVLLLSGQAAFAWALPNLATNLLFGEPGPRRALVTYTWNPILAALLRLLATSMGFAAVVCYALKLAANRDRLHLPGYQRLNLGLLLWAAAGVPVLLNHAEVLTPPAVVAGMVTLWLAGVIGASQYLRCNSGPGLLADLAAGLSAAARQVFHWRSLRGMMYATFTLNFLAAGLGYLAAPDTTLRLVWGETAAEEGRLLWRLLGAGLMLLPVASAILKTMVDVRTSGAIAGQGTYRLLNLGLAAAGAGHLYVMWPRWAAARHTHLLRHAVRAGPLLGPLVYFWAAVTIGSAACAALGPRKFKPAVVMEPFMAEE